MKTEFRILKTEDRVLLFLGDRLLVELTLSEWSKALSGPMRGGLPA